MTTSVYVRTYRLFFYVQAANYMDMQNLLDFACKVCASWIKGKTAEEIRDFFGPELMGGFQEEEKKLID